LFFRNLAYCGLSEVLVHRTGPAVVYDLLLIILFHTADLDGPSAWLLIPGINENACEAVANQKIMPFRGFSLHPIA
jgi:hypothetical protein